MSKLLAINGKIGSGKDTIAKIIIGLAAQEISHYPSSMQTIWEVKKFAGKLKEIASLLTGINIADFEDQEFKKSFLPDEWNIIPKYEWGDEPKDPRMTVRTFLQKLGTEALRDGLHTNVWVNALFSDYTVNSNWLITDCRFTNEYDAIKQRGGLIIRVNRVTGNPVSNHPSETSLDNHKFDYVIDNNGSLTDLESQVKIFLKDFNLV